MHPKGLSDAGAEAICLNQCTNKRTDVVNSGAVDEVTESLGAGLAGTHLEVHEMELVAEVGVGMVQVLADPGQCLVEGEAGFDANDRKIQGIGQPQADPVLPVTRPTAPNTRTFRLSKRPSAMSRKCSRAIASRFPSKAPTCEILMYSSARNCPIAWP